MSEKLKNVLKWSAFIAVTVGVVIFGIEQKKAYDIRAPYEAAKAISAEESERQHNEMLALRREMGFVEKVNYTNAFGDITSSVTNVLGRTLGQTLTITRDASGKLDSVCFSAISDDEKRSLFSPYFSTKIYAKFDGGDTKEFAAKRGSNEMYLCVISPRRFLFNMESAKVMQVQLIFLDHYSKVPEVHEWNLTTFNDVVKK